MSSSSPRRPPTTPLGHKQRRVASNTTQDVIHFHGTSVPVPDIFQAAAVIQPGVQLLTLSPPRTPPTHALTTSNNDIISQSLSISPEELEALSKPLLTSPERLQHAYQTLENETQTNRLKLAEKTQADKQTAATYARHYGSYTIWWDSDQAARVKSNPDEISAIPALPITAAKVAMFLEYESTRQKVRRGIVFKRRQY